MSSSRKRALAVTLGLGAFCLLALPVSSWGVKVGPVDTDQATSEVTGQLGVGGGSGGGGGGPRAGFPNNGPDAGYQPPLHGDNPHGQGTVATVDFFPSDTVPLSGDPAGGEDIVLGRSRGEQNGSQYHGHVTLVSLFGFEIVGADTNPGQSSSGPIAPLQGVFDAICPGCISLLAVNSSTTNTSSNNSFQAVALNLGPVSARALGSEGNISEDGSCQTSEGSAEIAGLTSATATGLGARGSG